MFKNINFNQQQQNNWENRHIIEYDSPASPDVSLLPDETCQNLDCKTCFPEIPLDFRPMTPLSSDVSSVYSFENEEDDLNSSGFQSQSDASDVISERRNNSLSPSTDFDETYFSVSKILCVTAIAKIKIICFYLFLCYLINFVLNNNYKKIKKKEMVEIKMCC